MMNFADNLTRYQWLLDVARSLNRVTDFHSLLEEILRRSQDVLGVEACSLFLLDPKTDELVIHSARGNKAPLLAAARIPKGAGIAGSVFESQKTLTIKDAKNDPRHYSKIDKEIDFVTRSMITTPLMDKNECLGVLQAINPVGRELFDEMDEALCETFGGLIVSVLVRLEAQKREIEQVRVRQELELASEIQHSFLPESFLAFESCRVYMNYSPAKQVGGDFCFFQPCKRHHRFLMALGDVSGKGVPAALTMARVTATIKSTFCQLDNDLGSWVSEINRQLTEDMRGGRFVSITFLLADAKEEKIHICAAGQYPPLYTNGQSWKQLKIDKQLPLGILPTFSYTAQSFPLHRGDGWLLFSDGITEARNAQGEEFTEEKFLQSLKTNESSSTVFAEAIRSWESFVNGAPQHDDASLFFLDWRGQPPPSEFKQTCEPQNLCHGRKFIEEWAKFAGFNDTTVGHIVLACDEASANVFRHAYHEKPGPMTLQAGIEDNYFVIRLKDEGDPVPPEQIKGRSLDDLKPGGLGTILIAQTFDHVEYLPQPKGTLLLLKKKLSETK